MSKVKTDQKMITIDEAKDALGVSKATFYRYVSEGLIKKYKILKSTRFAASEIDALSKLKNK